MTYRRAYGSAEEKRIWNFPGSNGDVMAVQLEHKPWCKYQRFILSGSLPFRRGHFEGQCTFPGVIPDTPSRPARPGRRARQGKVCQK